MLNEIAIAVTFLCGITGCSAPLWWKTSELLISLGDCFSGGIFLAVALVHMLTDAQEDLARLQGTKGLPIAMLIAAGGYLLTLFLGKVALSTEVMVSVSDNKDDAETDKTIMAETSTTSYLQQSPCVNEQHAFSTSVDQPVPPESWAAHSRENAHLNERVPLLHGAFSALSACQPPASNDERLTAVENNHGHRIKYSSLLFEQGLNAGLALGEHLIGEQERPRLKTSTERQGGKGLVSYVVLVVLSVHSIIAGVAMGFQKDVSDVAGMLVAISVHKLSAAVALGLSLIKADLTGRRFWGAALLFSSMTPLGIAIATAVQATASHDSFDVVSGVFGALGAGTFLYIACSHVLIEAFEVEQHRLLKFAVCLVGFGVMSAVAIWA